MLPPMSTLSVVQWMTYVVSHLCVILAIPDSSSAVFVECLVAECGCLVAECGCLVAESGCLVAAFEFESSRPVN